MKQTIKEAMTTISIKRSTKERLMEFGRKGETYDDILNRVMDGYKQWLEKRKEMPLVMLKREEINVKGGETVES
jgi:hypothetical protein